MRKLLMTLALISAPALADPAPVASPVPASTEIVTVVAVPIPAGLTNQRLAAGMHASVPQYQAIPGLIRKYFTIGDDVFGGVYLWRDRAAAQAWFNTAWHDRVIKTYGKDGVITYYLATDVMEGRNP